MNDRRVSNPTTLPPIEPATDSAVVWLLRNAFSIPGADIGRIKSYSLFRQRIYRFF